MATGWFGPCPHCSAALSYLEGVSSSSMQPKCPRCKQVVVVTRATFLMLDHSRPSAGPRLPASAIKT